MSDTRSSRQTRKMIPSNSRPLIPGAKRESASAGAALGGGGGACMVCISTRGVLAEIRRKVVARLIVDAVVFGKPFNATDGFVVAVADLGDKVKPLLGFQNSHF